MELILKDKEWYEQAACAETNPEIFTPKPGEKNIAKAAKRICEMCTVIDDCLIASIIEGDVQHSIRGGMTAKQRRNIAKRVEDG